MENTNVAQPEKVLYTGKTHTVGGRNGASQSSDDRLNIKLSLPGAPGTGTNPEQLFAAGWSACFLGAMGIAAAKLNIKIPQETFIDAEVDLCQTDGAYSLQARLNVSMPGLDKKTAEAVVEGAHLTCPYSKATRNNIAVSIQIL